MHGLTPPVSGVGPATKKWVLRMKQCASQQYGTWRSAISELTDLFIAYRDLNTPKSREKHRSVFYQEYRRLSMVAAMGTMASINWGGDRSHDAEEIASAGLIILLKQEEEERGLFRQPHSPINNLRGYLSQTIWIGVKSQSRDQLHKEQLWNQVSEDISGFADKRIEQKAPNLALRIDLKEALEKVRSLEGKIFQLPGGVIPLDGLLEEKIAGMILSYVPKRTWQRYCHESKERLARALKSDE